MAADCRHQRSQIGFWNICSQIAVTIFIAGNYMVAHFIVTWNGAAGDGVFHPAHKAVYVVNFNFAFCHIANLTVAGTFNAPNNYSAFRIAKTGYTLRKIAPIVTA